MTREEAIERLEFLKVVYDLDEEKAIDTAIEALSADAVQGDAISKRFVSDAILQKISDLNAQGEKAIPIAREFIRFKRFVDGITPIRAEAVDCISRQEARKAIEELYLFIDERETELLKELIEETIKLLPPVTPTEKDERIKELEDLFADMLESAQSVPMSTPTERTGEWIGSGDGYDWNGELVYDIWECSKCGYTVEEDDTDLLPKYCQECGAKMK